MMSSMTFSYAMRADEGKKYFVHHVNEVSMYLLMKKEGNGVAVLSAADDKGERMALPPGYTMISHTDHAEHEPSFPGAFVIVLGEKYAIRYQGRTVLSLYDKREHEVMLPAGTCETHPDFYKKLDPELVAKFAALDMYSMSV